jgi:hypothetical protein
LGLGEVCREWMDHWLLDGSLERPRGESLNRNGT